MSRKTNGFDAFEQPGVPTIACFNRARTPLGIEFDALIVALQTYLDEHVMPVWGKRAKLFKSTDFIRGAWAMVFLDTPDQPGALAYHDLTPEGLPVAKVFVRTALQSRQTVSVAASHRLVEMVVDPAINTYATGPDAKTLYAYESADPVEELTFKVNGMKMSNFVYPTYFEGFREKGSVKFDHLNKVQRPFEVLPGGCQIVSRNGKTTQVFGSKAKVDRFMREDRRGHRGEVRRTGKLKPADFRRLLKTGLLSSAGAKAYL